MTTVLRVRFDNSALREQVSGLTETLRRRVIGRATDAMARVVRKVSRGRNYGFRDATGYVRKSIRVERARQPRGRRSRPTPTRLVAGGVGAEQAYLIEEGHGGSRPAPAHSYLRAAFNATLTKQFAAGLAKVRSELPKAIAAAERANRRNRRK